MARKCLDLAVSKRVSGAASVSCEKGTIALADLTRSILIHSIRIALPLEINENR